MFMKTKETLDLLNSWQYILAACLEGRDAGASGEPMMSVFEDVPTRLKIFGVFVPGQAIALWGAMVPLVFPDLPGCILPTLRRFGLITHGLLPDLVWQIIMFPLEYASYLSPMLIATLAADIAFIT